MSFTFSDEEPIDFSFRGAIEDGKLKGLGKLKLGSKVDSSGSGTCITLSKLLGQDPVEIIGTFVNGVLHGNAKITLSDGKVVISNFANGLADGLRREWDENGNLIYVGFSQSGANIGKAWQKAGKNLVS